jgi:H+/Cl- antiporter ClcA
MVAPGVGHHQPTLMLVGMAAVAAAVIGSPLTMAFLVLEGTDKLPGHDRRHGRGGDRLDHRAT